jgi:hypothetical protein
MGSPRLSFCSEPLRIREGSPLPDVGLGKMILPFNVSANTAVRKFPISSSFLIPFLASFAERVPFGMTTPSKTTSAALLFLVPANAIPFQFVRRAQHITPWSEAPHASFISLVAPPGLEPGLSALKGPRVNQLHHGAKHTTNPTTQLYAVCFVETEEEKLLVALPGLEPGLFALRGRRVNQLHHNARTAYSQEDVLSSALTKYSKQQPRTQGSETQIAATFTPPQTTSTFPTPGPIVPTPDPGTP